MSRNRPGSVRGASGRRLRQEVARRDGAVCFYCRRPLTADTWTLDHYVPYSVWRRNEFRNFVLACQPCNSRKADALPVLFAWLLLRAYQLDQSRLEVAA